MNTVEKMFERLDVYTSLLERYESGNGVAFRESTFGPINYGMCYHKEIKAAWIRNFPELMAQKPYNASGYWWAPDALEPRINALKAAIRLTVYKIILARINDEEYLIFRCLCFEISSVVNDTNFSRGIPVNIKMYPELWAQKPNTNYYYTNSRTGERTISSYWWKEGKTKNRKIALQRAIYINETNGRAGSYE